MDREAVLISMTTVVIVMFLTDLFALSVYWNGEKLTKIKSTQDSSTTDIYDYDFNDNDLRRVEVGNYGTKDLENKPDVKVFQSEKTKPVPVVLNFGFRNDIPPPGALHFKYYHYPNGHLTLLVPELKDSESKALNLKDQIILKHVMEKIMNKLKSVNGEIYSPPAFPQSDYVWFARHYLETIK